jgi:cell division protein FtsN
MAQLKQISRPFQIALVAVVVLFALWLVVLRHASSESSSPSVSSAQPATSSQPAPSSSSSASSASAGSSGSSGSSASGSSTYHGSAPGVAGLTRAIAKARGAVAQSQQNSQRLQSKEKQASSASSAAQATAAKPASTTSAKSVAGATPAPANATPKATPQSAAKPSTGAASPAARANAGIPALQSKVEAQLKHGQLVAILLWNPKGAVDKVVHSNLQGAERSFSGKLAVHVATSGQVGSFGAFTRTVQVYSTPTILLINPKGATSSVTGLTDSFAIDQAIREAKLAG